MGHVKPGHKKKALNRTRWQLTERIKELTALHQTAGILQGHDSSIDDAMRKVLEIIPPAWQYPDITGSRIIFNGREYTTGNFRVTRWMQREKFQAGRKKGGSIEVCYLKRRPVMDEGPFLAEERALIVTLAELLRLFFHSHLYRRAMERMNRKLELQVRRRTAELVKSNRSLRQEVNVRQELDRQLRKLASELVLAEARERRTIAGDLHDHIGQALALVRQKLQVIQGYSAFSGSEKEVGSIQVLIDQIIHYTRTLTVELSPPVLYELGLGPALASLAEQFHKKHNLQVKLKSADLPPDLGDDGRIILYSATRELLTNVVKHARSNTAMVSADFHEGIITIVVSDNGKGCLSLPAACDGTGFGLFSIRERLKQYGGLLTLKSRPGKGTVATLTMPIKRTRNKDETDIDS